MEPIYTVKSVCTKEEYIRYNRFILNKEAHLGRFYFLFVAIVVIWIIACVIKGQYLECAAPLLVLAYIAYAFYVRMDRKASKVYDSNETMKDLSAGYEVKFYDDHYEVKTPNGNSAVDYSKIHRVYFTPDNVYLLQGQNVGHILQKENFPEGLEEFLLKLKDEYGV